ncbi:MAG: hypothetical protein N2652_00540 [Kiritimatiellae bacterium]|nr:hypothetical protein [Kiritimatiellia bacterium]
MRIPASPDEPPPVVRAEMTERGCELIVDGLVASAIVRLEYPPLPKLEPCAPTRLVSALRWCRARRAEFVVAPDGAMADDGETHFSAFL